MEERRAVDRLWAAMDIENGWIALIRIKVLWVQNPAMLSFSLSVSVVNLLSISNVAVL